MNVQLMLSTVSVVVFLSGFVAAQSPERVLVVNTSDASVSVVNLVTMSEERREKVGMRPYGIAISRDRTKVAIGVEEEECVKFFSLPEFELLGKTKIGPMHNDHIVLTQDGQSILVANFYSDDVVGIDVATMKASFRIEGCSAPHVVKYGPLSHNAYVTCKKVTGIAIIDPTEQKLVKFHQINVNPRSLTFSKDETKVYFGSFWVDGFFEMDAQSGKVLKLHALPTPQDNSEPQEVTYHGVEALSDSIVVAANEGRSYVDAVDVTSGKLLDRLTDVSKPCCVERIPRSNLNGSVQFLVSNLGDGTLQVVAMSGSGKLTSKGKVSVGAGPKRVTFLD